MLRRNLFAARGVAAFANVAVASPMIMQQQRFASAGASSSASSNETAGDRVLSVPSLLAGLALTYGVHYYFNETKVPEAYGKSHSHGDGHHAESKAKSGEKKPFKFTPAQRAEMLDRIRAIKLTPDGSTNLAIKHFDFDEFAALSEADQDRFLFVIASGVMHPDSQMGCYASSPDDYDYPPFLRFFQNVIAEYHREPVGTKHASCWDLSKIPGLPADGKLDLAQLGLPPLSMRVRTGRNLADFPLPSSMSKEDRVQMERKMCEAFKLLIADPRYGGRYVSITPGHPDAISEQEYTQLVNEHIMFKDMSRDSYLVDAGIARDWPYGRGAYISGDRKVIVWVGEEDHLRIMAMQKGTVLNDVFERLRGVVTASERIPGLRFAVSPNFGVVTSCPTNCGTGMRASVHIQLPKLTADGTDKRAKAIAKPLGLSVRGLGGEHTPIGDDGTVDISPSARFAISEAQILGSLYSGIRLLKEKHDSL